MPARQICFDRGRLYINGNSRLFCLDSEEGRVLWKGRQYQYQPDPLLQTYANLARNFNPSGKRLPSTNPEIQLFGDRLHPLVTVHDDSVYAIEGQLLDWGVKPNDGTINNTSVYLAGRHRSRKNWMAAYDAATGKLKWHRPAAEATQLESGIPIGFLASPLPFGDNLLVPVSNKGELWVYSLRQDTGETVWKVFLRDEPVDGVSPWSAIGTAIEGGDLYLTTGMGYVFALDAATGKVHWAVQYTRKSSYPSANLRGFNPSAITSASNNGWIDDIVIPSGNQLVVLPSDYDRIVTLDRRNGKLLWDASQVPSENEPRANYCVGVSGEDLYVGSGEVIRKYNIPSGKLKWDQPIKNSLGQAALTSEGVFVPTENSIVKLDNRTGKIIARAEVYSPTGEPVGNLVSDGRHLYGVGLQRIYSLASLTDRLQLLAKKIDNGDGEAQLTRMRIHIRQENREAAISDLESAIPKLRARQGFWRSWEALNTGL
ncbi:MAG: PQQ-binding-like beta-propeller repeat protein, partial [Planctomycetaceae bacterium]|nr:PQQ-binding-like beta-propeller repeat protein [Planctomycetaceae bacterium]